jgi:hypothetical protein
MIRINPSCYTRTMDLIITADDSEEIKILDKWLDWTWTLPQLFQQPESKVVISAIDRLRTKISGRFDTEVLIQELETMTKEAKALAQENILSHWIFTSPGAMIGGTILCLASAVGGPVPGEIRLRSHILQHPRRPLCST